MALTEVNSKGIKDADIATGDIADDAITSAKIADDAVVTAAIADDAIRWGDNDRIAALLAQLLNAEQLLMLTDTEEPSSEQN